jgi:hypothetical protein
MRDGRSKADCYLVREGVWEIARTALWVSGLLRHVVFRTMQCHPKGGTQTLGHVKRVQGLFIEVAEKATSYRVPVVYGVLRTACLCSGLFGIPVAKQFGSLRQVAAQPRRACCLIWTVDHLNPDLPCGHWVESLAMTPLDSPWLG